MRGRLPRQARCALDQPLAGIVGHEGDAVGLPRRHEDACRASTASSRRRAGRAARNDGRADARRAATSVRLLNASTTARPRAHVVNSGGALVHRRRAVAAVIGQLRGRADAARRARSMRCRQRIGRQRLAAAGKRRRGARRPPSRRRDARAATLAGRHPSDDRRAAPRRRASRRRQTSARLPGASTTRPSRAENGSAGWPSMAMTIAAWRSMPQGQQRSRDRIEQAQPQALVGPAPECRASAAVDGDTAICRRIDGAVGATRPVIEDQQHVAVDRRPASVSSTISRAVERALGLCRGMADGVVPEGAGVGRREAVVEARRPARSAVCGQLRRHRPWRWARARRASGARVGSASSLTSRTLQLLAALDPQHRARRPRRRRPQIWRRRLHPARAAGFWLAPAGAGSRHGCGAARVRLRERGR